MFKSILIANYGKTHRRPMQPVRWMGIFAIALIPLSAMAAEPDVDCSDPNTQAEMSLCAYKDYERADVALNAQWNLTVAALQARDNYIDRRHNSYATHYDTLLAAQRAWLTYRDAHCLGESFWARGGTLAQLLESSCKASLTAARTAQLKELIENY